MFPLSNLQHIYPITTSNFYALLLLPSFSFTHCCYCSGLAPLAQQPFDVTVPPHPTYLLPRLLFLFFLFPLIATSRAHLPRQDKHLPHKTSTHLDFCYICQTLQSLTSVISFFASIRFQFPGAHLVNTKSNNVYLDVSYRLYSRAVIETQPRSSVHPHDTVFHQIA